MTMMPATQGRPRKTCAQYGVGNLYTSLSHAVAMSLSFTKSENLQEALDSPLTSDEFRDIETGLAAMQAHPEHRHDYIARQTFLSNGLLHLPVWTGAVREAVAYATLRVGMHSHGYSLRENGTGFLIGTEPQKLFLLHKTPEELLRALRRGYELSPSREEP
jgi:hypothetical protein